MNKMIPKIKIVNIHSNTIAYLKLRKKYNTLKINYDVLESETKEETFKIRMASSNDRAELKRLRKNSKNDRLTIKELKRKLHEKETKNKGRKKK